MPPKAKRPQQVLPDEAEALLSPQEAKNIRKLPSKDVEEDRFVAWSRISMTKFEKKVWKLLGGDDNPWRFQCQVPKFGYVLDFYSEQFMLCIEADGPAHQKQLAADNARDVALAKMGIQTLRIVPADFVEHTAQQLFDLIEAATHPEHLLNKDDEVKK